MNTLISPGYWIINSHLRHTAPHFHNHCTIYAILPFIPQSWSWQVDKTRWIKSHISSYSSFKLQFNPEGKIKWRSSQKTSQEWSHKWYIRFKILNTQQKIRVHQRLRIIPLWYRLTIRLHYRKVEIIQKLVSCGLSNMIPPQQNSMKYSSRQNSKATLLWTSITSTTKSICISMQWLDPNKNFFLITSTQKDALILKITSS